jgi:hypothetical protein
MMILTIYLTLFTEKEYFFENQIYFKFSNDFRKIIEHMNEQLCTNEFGIKLKIMVFIQLINSMEPKSKQSGTIRKKRLTDLIKSEFSQFKFSTQKYDVNVDGVFRIDQALCGSHHDDEKSLNQDAFNSFLLLIIESQVLINQYFNMSKF